VIDVPFDDSVQVLTENQCLALLNSHEVGRIAFQFKGRIEVFPMNYAMDGAIIVFRTSPGTKLEGVPNSVIAFEVDGWDPESGIGWSVVAKGAAEEVTTGVGRVAEHLRWVPVHPVAPGERYHWLAIKPSEITGRQFHVPPARSERL
jgi:nitroimidazol reductase NimA-like FMN-containing flavoprotein (pyridoxamine 5'-phosphate oxidase superfamily)